MRIEYDKLIDRYFLRQPDGRSIYRTWGSLGRSYWVDTAEREQLIRDANRRRLKASRILLPLLIAPAFLMGHLSSSSLYLGWVMLLCTWGAFFLWWEWRNKKLTKGLERAPRLRGHASRERRPSWLDTMAAGQSFTAFLVQLVVLGALAAYAAQDVARAWPPTMSGIMGVVIFWPLELILAAALITKIRKRAVLGGPSPEQQFTKAVFRPLWMLPAVLFLLAIVLLFLQALHRR